MPQLAGTLLSEGICLKNVHGHKEMLVRSCWVRKAKTKTKKIGSKFYKYEKLRIFGGKEGSSIINP